MDHEQSEKVKQMQYAVLNLKNRLFHESLGGTGVDADFVADAHSFMQLVSEYGEKYLQA